MTARLVRTAGLLTVMVAVPLAGCGGHGAGGEERRASAVEAARRYQQAQLDKEWKVACEAVTQRLRRGTVAACVEERNIPSIGSYPEARVTTGKPFDMEADGPHAAGVGVRVTLYLDPATGNRIDTALRLVPGEDGAWLVDQAANLDASLGTGPDAARARLDEAR
ncbi:hypothetical protein [Streptomyces sp. NBC_00887]|uniref:hypothetical protein n=1 Tax=Streptomyces sp. NBC_00887 TaxID=2975859 RepID=UPI00386E5FE5|nr:hypothetical protein OG844_34920 [Streptomyces sp. NBC_00887]